MFYGANLWSNVGTSIYRNDVHAVDILAEVFQIISNLHAEFARRTKHNGLGRTVLCINFLQEGQSEGCSLACSCLCKRNDIILVA